MSTRPLRRLTGVLLATATVALGLPAAGLASTDAAAADRPDAGPAPAVIDESVVERLAEERPAVEASAPETPTVALPTLCPQRPAHQIFAFVGDANWYFLAPGGDFEGPSDWAFAGPVSIVERFDFTAFFGSGTLRVEAGGTASSPELCVDHTLPHLRTGLRADRRDARLRIEAVAGDRVVRLATLSGRRLLRGGISRFVPLGDALELGPATSEQVSLRLTALVGTWEIDGVAVDPKSTR